MPAPSGSAARANVCDVSGTAVSGTASLPAEPIYKEALLYLLSVPATSAAKPRRIGLEYRCFG